MEPPLARRRTAAFQPRTTPSLLTMAMMVLPLTSPFGGLPPSDDPWWRER